MEQDRRWLSRLQTLINRGSSGEGNIPKIPDRYTAGMLLGEKLLDFHGKRTRVIAIPNGGVVVGQGIADTINVDLMALATQRILHRAHSDIALGAVAEGGAVYWNERELAALKEEGFSKDLLVDEIAYARKRARERGSTYREGNSLDIKGKLVILTDDGIATGSSMRAAMADIRDRNPKRLVVAASVCHETVAADMRRQGVELITLIEPPPNIFRGVSLWYEEFKDVTDSEVMQILQARPR